jgi:tetratricopeptide (TPR) repeat protein
MGGLIMQRIFILLFCFALLACASTPKPTQEQLCIEAEKDKALAKTVLTYDKLQAVRYAMEAQKICPTPVNSAYLAFINSEAGMIDMGVLWAQHAMKQDSNNVEVLTLSSWAYVKAEKYNDAIALLGRALNYAPKDANARQSLAEIYLMQREMQKAEVEFLKNIQNNPTYSPSYYFVGKLYMDEYFDFEKANEYLSGYAILDMSNSYGLLPDTKKRLTELKSKIKEQDAEEAKKSKPKDQSF